MKVYRSGFLFDDNQPGSLEGAMGHGKERCF